MFWQNSYHYLLPIILGLHVDVWAAHHLASSSCRDPFYPLYVSDPRNEYEKGLSDKAKNQLESSSQIQMVVCDDAPWVMFNGIVYHQGDSYLNGIITHISCTEVVVENDNSQIITRLVDQGVIEKSGEGHAFTH